MEKKLFGRIMGMRESGIRGNEYCLRKEKEIILPSVPQSIRIRVEALATLPINDRRVREACSTVNTYRRTDFCRKRLALRLDIGWSIVAREESGSRSTSSDGSRPTDEVSDTSSLIIDLLSEDTVVE